MSERAFELASAFEQRLAKRRTASDAEREATDLRNRAAAHLHEAKAEIRSAGAFAIRDDPSILPLFRSAYRRRHRGGGGGSADADPSDG